jgi:hypothetical protein
MDDMSIFLDFLEFAVSCRAGADELIDVEVLGKEEEDEDDEGSDERYEDEEEESQDEYNGEFRLPVSGVYIDRDGTTRIEYSAPYEEIFPDAVHEIKEHSYESQQPETSIDLALMEHPEVLKVDYRETVPELSKSLERLQSQSTYKADVLSIKYDNTELINGQKTYQRIVFKADADGESVYELSMRKFKGAGIEASAEYENEFDSMIFTSINRKAEGAGGNFNEFYLNGEIGTNAADMQKLKKGDTVEWRYAEETDGSCGGVPDFDTIKGLLEYNKARSRASAYNGMAMMGGGYPGVVSPLHVPLLQAA